MKENLNFAALNVERSDKQETLWVIPINNRFKTGRINDPTAHLSLLVFVNTSGEIRKENIVVYVPEGKQNVTMIPPNTFRSIISTGDKISTNGEYRFLSISGRKLYNLRFKDGSLYSETLFTKDPPQKSNVHVNGTKVNVICIDWWEVTTIHGLDGRSFTITG